MSYVLKTMPDGREAIMAIEETDNPFAELVAISQLYKQGELSDHDYLRNIIECFRDDHGEDWIDADCLRLLAERLSP